MVVSHRLRHTQVSTDLLTRAASESVAPWMTELLHLLQLIFQWRTSSSVHVRPSSGRHPRKHLFHNPLYNTDKPKSHYGNIGEIATAFLGLHYITLETFYSGLSKTNFKNHYGDAATEQCLGIIAEINAFSVSGEML